MVHALNTSRRGFIKTGTIAAAGFMIVPRYVLGGKGYTLHPAIASLLQVWAQAVKDKAISLIFMQAARLISVIYVM